MQLDWGPQTKQTACKEQGILGERASGRFELNKAKQMIADYEVGDSRGKSFKINTDAVVVRL